MVGEMMNRKGVTLIELLVVLSILAIVAAIGIPQYNKWKRKYSIENDTKELYGLIQKERTKAFTQKISVDIVLNGKNVTIKENNVIVGTVTLKNNFSGGPITIDSRGTLNGSSIYYSNSQDGLNPQYNCVAVSNIRVKLGEYNGNSCNAK
jgi:prepilin-type N-terminal cleavage/methylation domain-containing protein